MKIYEPFQLCSEQQIYRPQKLITLKIEFPSLTQCCADGSEQLLGEGSPSLLLGQGRIGVEGNGLHGVDSVREPTCCASDDKEQV